MLRRHSTVNDEAGMLKPHVVLTTRGESLNATLEVRPDECPVCHRSVRPEVMFLSMLDPPSRRHLEVVFRCTSEPCRTLFIGYYQPPVPGVALTNPEPFKRLVRTAPRVARPQVFPEEVTSLSPAFRDLQPRTRCRGRRPQPADRSWVSESA